MTFPVIGRQEDSAIILLTGCIAMPRNSSEFKVSLLLVNRRAHRVVQSARSTRARRSLTSTPPPTRITSARRGLALREASPFFAAPRGAPVEDTPVCPPGTPHADSASRAMPRALAGHREIEAEG